MRVLVIEDSDLIRRAIVLGLQREGYAVDFVTDGRQALIHLRTTQYAAAILDLMLPEMDGLTVLSEARAKGVATPVLILTARDSVNDRVAGLRRGADDYLIKPFAIEELLARVAALARRGLGQSTSTITIGDLVIDSASRTVSRAGVPVTLSRREYAILEYLAMRRGRIVARHEIEEHVYDGASQVFSNAIDSAISLIRKKLRAAGTGDLIRTRRGHGYILDEANDVDP